jgi:hypothetical protein
MQLYVLIPVIFFYVINAVGIWELFQIREALEVGGLSSNAQLFDSLAKNLATRPIGSIVTAEGNCPAGTSEVQYGYWPGIIEGCYCAKGDSYTAGHCASDPGNPRQCQGVPKQEKAAYKVWKKMKVCVSRVDYATLPGLRETCSTAGVGCCAPNEKTCDADLCVPMDKPCPVTRLVAATASDKNETITFGDGSKFAVKREAMQRAMVFVGIERDVPACLDEHLSPAGSPAPYPLLDPVHVLATCGGWGFATDTTFEIDKQNEKAALEENGIFNGKNAPVNFENSIKMTTVSLFSRHAVKRVMKAECLALNMEAIGQFSEVIGLFRTYLMAFGAGGIALLMLGAAGALLFYDGWKMLEERFRPMARPVCAFSSGIFFLVLVLLLSLLRWAMCVGGVAKLRALHADLVSFTEAGCLADGRYLRLLTEISVPPELKGLSDWNLWLLIVVAVMTIGISFAGWYNYKYDLDRDVERQTMLASGMQRSDATRVGGS